MHSPGNDLLLVAGKVVAIILQGLMAIGAAALVIALPFVAFFSTDIATDFADGSAIDAAALPVLPLVGALAIGVAILVALFLFFGKLRAVIDTVGEGDPFIPANAERLSMMAWLLLATQLLTWPLIAFGLMLAEWAQELDEVDISFEADGFDLTGILMVLVLFILARVFRHGAAMRADLEGTV
ncbi:MAG: DUF2975 domain-containing protein [Erythrobacter sp.]|jgi:hypothetical protein|nr:DUF2975 domain-containing protein [Erythrobacter sp.]